MTSLRARTSALAAATLVGALAVSGSAITAHAATTALSPASGPIDCPTAYPLSSVKDGIQGIGWTVSKGTTPERFDANVLGVLKDGVGYGFDIILAEVSSPALTKAGGVWAGMSGSPVYAPDGRLLGAVAYTLTYGPSLIAGITPAEDMMPLGASAAATAKATAQAQARLAAKPQVSLPSSLQQRLKAEGVSSSAAAAGLRRLQVPVWVSGMQGKFQQKLVDKLSSRGLDARVGGSTSTGTATPGSQIHAGGNFAAALSTGAVTLGGVGTTTFVCNGRAVAFGHPMTGAGPVSFPALAADVVTVVADPAGSPFKAANFGGVVGTLDKDTVSGISAKLDAMPTGGTQVISVVVGPDGKNRRMASTVYDSRYGANVAANQIYAAGLKTLGGDAPGTGTLNLAISGVRANGSAFMYTRSDKLSAGAGDSLPYALGDQVFGFAGALVDQGLEDVTITKITMTSKITSVPSGLKFSGLSYKKGSTWVAVSDAKTPTIMPGTLTLRTVLGPQKGASGSPVSQEFPITIPDTLAGEFLDVTVEGGVDPYMIDVSGATTFDQLLAQLRKLPSSTTLKVTVNAESLSKPIVATATLAGPVTPFGTWTSFQVAGGDSAKG